MKAVTRILGFACFVLAASHIFGATQQQSSAETPTGIRLDVPFVAQGPDGCGSAAISMLLQYWNAHGTPVDSARGNAQAIQHLLYSKKARGILASDMEKYLRDSAFTVFAVQGNWQDLSSHLRQGRPLIVALQPSGKKSPRHYVVVVGMDSKNPALLVHDPARGKLLRIDRAEFEREWQPLGNWTLLAVPAQAN